MVKKKKSKRKAKRKASKKTKRIRLGVAVGSVVVLVGVVYCFHLVSLITKHFEGRRWDIPSRIYSDVFALYPGLDLQNSGFFDRLERLSYLEVDRPVENPGEFFEDEDKVEVYFQSFEYPSGTVPARPVRFYLRDGQMERMERIDSGSEPFTEKLEPEVIAEFFGESREERLLVSLEEVPDVLQNAVIAVEDNRFYQHSGLDFRAISRAFLANLKAGSVRQGGSTLTQQLVKNFFLSPKRSYWRKANEALMALIVEARYSKEEILVCYLNEVYFGQRGSVAIHGVGEASRYYFGKRISDISLSEAAVLAGIIKGPAIYSPYRNYEKSRKRQRVVLQLMFDHQYIQEEEMLEAISSTLALKKPHVRGTDSAYFVDLVRRNLKENYPEEALTWEGFRIFSTIDMQMQMIVNQELKKGLQNLERIYPRLTREKPEEVLQGAVVLVQPQTGSVLALAGGRSFAKSQFNRALFAYRQPGSLFKPIVALTALMNEDNREEPITPVTELQDEEFVMKTPTGESWEPQNYDLRFRGPVTLREAMEQSINIPMIRLAQDVGLDRIVEVGKRLGIESSLQPVASLALGTSEVTPFELSRVFSTLVNQGVRPELRSVRDVLTQSLDVLERRSLEGVEVVPAGAAYLTVDLMVGVMEKGTGRSVRAFGVQRPVAGKTGTTSEYRDAWFVGFTPDLLALVWIGFDDNFSLELPGAAAALPIWANIMNRSLKGTPPKPFLDPPGVVRMKIDRETKQKATTKCPKENRMEEVFLEGTEPKLECTKHPQGGGAKSIWKGFKGLFGKN